MTCESESRSVMSDSLQPHGLYNPWISPGQNTGVGSHFLLQGIIPTQGSNPGLLHCGWILYCLSHKRSPRIREWVAYPCSRGSSQPGNQTRVSCIAGGFFANELAGKPLLWSSSLSWVRVPPTWQGWPGFQVTSKLCGQQGWQTASPHLGICVLLLPLSR